mgnify:CR=1 FL=1
MGRLPRDRDVAGGDGDAHEPQRQRPHGALPRRRARRSAHAVTIADAVLDGEICALDDEGRSSFSLLQEGGGHARRYVLFDLLELDGEPLVDVPLGERASALEELVDRRSTGVSSRRQFDDGAALLRGRGASRSSRASSRSAPTRRTEPGTPLARLAQARSCAQTQEFVIAGYTRGQGRRAGGFGALVARRYTTRAGCAGPATSGRASSTARSSGCCKAAAAARARRDSPFAEVPKMPRVRSGGRHLGRADARRRGRVRRVDARGPAARAVVPRPARGQAGARGAPRASRCRRR